MTQEPLDPATFEVLRHRLWAINDEAAVTITRVSGSPIATEGNDFNSGLLTAEGEVVVAGIYVLVHAAALEAVVKDILANYGDNPGIGPGDMFITNDTYVGAPHQADVIIVAPIFAGDELIAWCGSCVHQADVGGPVAGSITVGAASIYEEALPMAPMRLVEAGRLRADIEREYLIRSRTPELNRLDMLGQIAANRVQTERVLELCGSYGTDVVVGAMTQLVDSTERVLRARLRSLPDGTWRHVGFVEHDGLSDKIYEIRLEMCKVDDRLVFDFTESSDQAPALINVTHVTAANYTTAAVMTVLGYGLPWVPSAFIRLIEVQTRPGSVVSAVMPAGMSMGVTSAGQEVRTSVNICIDRMLDASDDPEHHRQILASCTSSSATQTISGLRSSGEGFTTMLLDGLPAGCGARSFADGPDAGGFLTSPAGLCTNVEVTELHYPIRYLWRHERADSGGPGRWRGGIGAEHAYTLHGTDQLDSAGFAHGVEPATASGVLGGEPGLQNGFGIVRSAAVDQRVATPEDLGGTPERHAAKQVAHLTGTDVFMNWCAGGGGLGDPIDRDPRAVADDVAEGLVTTLGAHRDYAVVIGDDGDLLADETDELRAERRRGRIGGEQPRPAASRPPLGRRVSSSLVVAHGLFQCRRCGEVLGSAGVDVKSHLWMQESPATAHLEAAMGDLPLPHLHSPLVL